MKNSAIVVVVGAVVLSWFMFHFSFFLPVEVVQNNDVFVVCVRLGDPHFSAT
jgi:hypothetical protein